MKAIDLSKYIINKAIEFGKPISNLPLLKILYLVHIGFLKEMKKKLITDEKFEAWRWGPVIREVYDKYILFGSNKLDTPYEDVNLNLDGFEKRFIDEFTKELFNLKPWELVQKVHPHGGAWDKVYQDGKGDKQIIPDQLIKQEAEEL